MRILSFCKATSDRAKGSPSAGGRAKKRAAVSADAKLIACAASTFLAITSAALADPTALYPRMAPIGDYLMDRTQEIALARSAAPGSISNHATVLVLTRIGYETAANGTNGFVCWVSRSFSGGGFDSPEHWNPKIRAAECQNPQAARSVMPLAKLGTAMILAGRTTPEIIGAINMALRSGKVPPLEYGAMSYMMSKSSYLTDQGKHDMAHVMFYVAVKDPADWGANAADAPIIGGSYWFFTPGHEAENTSLPVISVFLSGVATWSDGTPASMHPM